MESTHKCRACSRKFKPDPRNRGRQSYCSRRDCQRQRRTLRQKQRRQQLAPQLGVPGLPARSRRPQTASVIPKADVRAENPVIIGLISMLTGLTTLEEIERVYRQLWLQGMNILSANHAQALQNPAIMSLFEKEEDQARGKG